RPDPPGTAGPRPRRGSRGRSAGRSRRKARWRRCRTKRAGGRTPAISPPAEGSGNRPPADAEGSPSSPPGVEDPLAQGVRPRVDLRVDQQEPEVRHARRVPVGVDQRYAGPASPILAHGEDLVRGPGAPATRSSHDSLSAGYSPRRRRNVGISNSSSDSISASFSIRGRSSTRSSNVFGAPARRNAGV
ncbi:MAG: hypothetical protein H6Q82_843, partial [Deltaproteobacteria bacterium]|nr:hypothetical protein [Deltaproteobacteria bacterium]